VRGESAFKRGIKQGREIGCVVCEKHIAAYAQAKAAEAAEKGDAVQAKTLDNFAKDILSRRYRRWREERGWAFWPDDVLFKSR